MDPESQVTIRDTFIRLHHFLRKTYMSSAQKAVVGVTENNRGATLAIASSPGAPLPLFLKS